MNLYELTEEYRQAQEVMQEMIDLGEIDQQTSLDSLACIEGDFEDKCINKAKVLKNIEADIDAMKNAEASITIRRKRAQKLYDQLKEDIKYSMEEVGKKKIFSPFFGLSVCNNGGKPSLFFDDKFNPEPFEKEVTKIVLDKDLVREKLESGQEIEGAKLVKSTHLRVK